MPLTENLIKAKNFDPALYKYHSTGSVAEYIAEKIQCTGIILTVSTACSSGALAVKLALEMLRTGAVKSVLAGGADALCRLTYHGFNSLQLIDPKGAHPLDIARKGMSVAEGAAMLLLTAGDEPPPDAIAEILGAGLSCDAYHPASPHPEGKGAADAMRAALSDAGILPGDVDYINLHGTGTIDNDLIGSKGSARGIREQDAVSVVHKRELSDIRLPRPEQSKPRYRPYVLQKELYPQIPDVLSLTLRLGLEPEKEVITNIKVNTVLSNSFGFGGNNAALVIGKVGKRTGTVEPAGAKSSICSWKSVLNRSRQHKRDY